MGSRLALLLAVFIAFIGVAVLMLKGKGAELCKEQEEALEFVRVGQPTVDEKARRRGADGGDRASRPRRGPTLATLTEQYGVERVEHAQRVVQHYLTYNEGAEHSVASIFGTPGIDRIMTQKLMTEAFGVGLNPDQEAKALSVAHAYALRELEDFKAARMELEKKPERLLALMLASDARFRGEITEDDYLALRRRYASAFGNLLDPLDHRSSKRLWEWDAVGDASLRGEVEKIFTADQLAVYQERVGDYDTSLEARELHGLAAMRVMSLEIHEASVWGNPWDPDTDTYLPGSTFKLPSKPGSGAGR